MTEKQQHLVVLPGSSRHCNQGLVARDGGQRLGDGTLYVRVLQGETGPLEGHLASVQLTTTQQHNHTDSRQMSRKRRVIERQVVELGRPVFAASRRQVRAAALKCRIWRCLNLRYASKSKFCAPRLPRLKYNTSAMCVNSPDNAPPFLLPGLYTCRQAHLVKKLLDPFERGPRCHHSPHSF